MQQDIHTTPSVRVAAARATARITNHDDPYAELDALNHRKRSNGNRTSNKKVKTKPKQEEIQKIASKYQGRLDYFKRKHRQSKAELITMEKFAAKTLENVEELMDGNITMVDEAFKNYKAAIEAYQNAQRLVRVTLLTERKLASEVWGANNISIYDEDNGTFTILENIIEELLHVEYYSPYEVKEKKERKAQNGNNKKPSKLTATPNIKKKLMPPENEKPKTKQSFRWSDYSCDEDMAITRSMSTRTSKKTDIRKKDKENLSKLSDIKLQNNNISKNESNGNNQQNNLKKKKIILPRSISPIVQKSVSAPNVGDLPIIPKVKQTSMPKFSFVEESIIKSKNAQQVVKDASAFMCNCIPDKNGYGCFSTCINHHLHMECGSRCFLKEKCQNKKFQNHQYASFEPFFAGAKGWGIRAKEKIKSGQFIVEYLGEIIDGNETTRRLKKYAKNNHRHHYMMGLRNGAVIDATTYGNYSRFINHSCDPNAETQKWVVSRQLKIGFFALKDILPGEEIVFDYAFERFGKKAQVCYCGTSKCTGFLGGKPVDDEEEENSCVEVSDDEETIENDTTITTINSDGKKIEKITKRKRTEEEKELLKRIARARKRVVLARREVRNVIRKKKNFNEEDIKKIVLYMVTAKTYEERLFVSDFFLTITDEQILKWFIGQKCILSVSLWLLDFTCGKSFKRTIRLQHQLVKFLSKLPIEYSDELNEGHILKVLQNRMESLLPQEVIISEMMKDMLFKICDDAPTKDFDVLRCLELDGESLLDLHESLVKDAAELYEKLSVLKPK
uniref:Histone-lysine N-methyltransferase n=1 Tax=Panagrolaimus sp. JU765 TaxID=591449 RepID=A0AC34PXQ5_9BILA